MKIPVIEQHDSSDCGVACVASICAYYGKEVSISKLRELMGTDAFGTSIHGISQGLEKLGFVSRAVFVDKESFSQGDYSLPGIARLVRADGTSHYVSVFSVRDGIVRYMDPAECKAQKKTVDEFSKDFDGGMILMVPNEEFVKDKARTKSLFSGFIKMMRPHKSLFIVAIGISIILTIFGIVMSLFNKMLIDEIIPYQEDRQLLLFGIALVIVVATQMLLSALRTHTVLYLSQKIDIPLMLGYFGHIFRLPMDFFASRKTGDVVTRFQDAGVVKDVLTSTALTVIIDVAMVLIVGIVLFTTSSKLFLIVVLMAILSALLIYTFKSAYRKLNRKSMEQGARLNSQVIESLNGIETVKTNSCEGHVMEKIETEYIRSLRISFKGGVLSNIQNTLSSGVTSYGNLAILLVGGFLAINGELTLGTLVAFMSLAGYFIDPIGRLVNLQLSIQEADISLRRLSELYDVDEEEDRESMKDSSAIENGIDNISAEHVTFAYGSRPPTLKDVSISLKKGERIALVGRSGCGKTTLSKLLLKFYLPNEGRISYNGSDIDDINAFSLRETVGCVPQDVRTFSGSIRENLLLGRKGVSKSEMDRICDISGCTEFLKKLPAGYDTYLDENGGGLSGGEKQRLAIARALLRRPDFLIFDEATSNMDFITEKKTYDLIFGGLKDTTILIIAHRLSTIRRCDRIYVMDDGRITECGTHDELMVSDGLYRQMWDSQIGESPEEENETETAEMEDDEGVIQYE